MSQNYSIWLTNIACKTNQKSLVFLPSSCPILSWGNIWWIIIFTMSTIEKDDALERWVSFSYRDGFTHRLKKGQTLHQSSIQKREAVLLCLVSPFFLPSQERKFKLEWKFSNRKSWQILLLCLTQTHSILERKWNHSTSNKKKKGESKQFPNFRTLHSIEKNPEVFFVTLHWRPHAGKRSGFIPLPNWPKSTNILGFEWDLKSQNMLWSK